ncbi:class I SAM-dependent methyltransferase [Elioraea rosea]|uniref:class I SAM-dependent methyltransferase n=1 Tax=Elioraea rosea TaxID=2492390 RepID=UPI001183BD78|nr:class I SAM-dependent methyltransferase [Elioraea rosea]
MPRSDAQFAGAIPVIYDRLMVPLIFEPYAIDLAERLAGAMPRAILEIAAGTGALTRMIAARVPAEARIVATDLNPPMLDQAAARLAGDTRIAWQQAEASALPFGNARFDVVACQFGAMFFPDKEQAYREARRVLKPGGRLLFNVWDRIAENEFAEAVTDALALLFPDDPPRFMAHIPHGYHDTKRIRAELVAAGFETVSVDAVGFVSRATSATDAAVAYCQGTPMRNEIEARDASGLAAATEAAAAALVRRFGRGPIEGRIRAYVIEAA